MLSFYDLRLLATITVANGQFFSQTSQTSFTGQIQCRMTSDHSLQTAGILLFDYFRQC